MILIERSENLRNFVSKCSNLFDFFHAHRHLSDSLTLFLIILPLFCVWKVDSKHGIFKGLNFGILKGSKGGWRKIDRCLLGFVMKISDGHPYHLYIKRTPPPYFSTIVLRAFTWRLIFRPQQQFYFRIERCYWWRHHILATFDDSRNI